MNAESRPLAVPDDETPDEAEIREMLVELRREQRIKHEQVMLLNQEFALVERRAQALRAAYAKLTEGRA